MLSNNSKNYWVPLSILILMFIWVLRTCPIGHTLMKSTKERKKFLNSKSNKPKKISSLSVEQMTNLSLIMSWKIIWKAWKSFSQEAKMWTMSILYLSFMFKQKRKDPSLPNLTSISIEKEQDWSKLILDSELLFRNLIASNLRLRPH